MTAALGRSGGELRIVSPFVKVSAFARLARGHEGPLRLITRFSHEDWAKGVSDIAALREVLARGGAVRGVRNLHAKLYLFGDSEAVVTSANLTSAGIDRNHEFGLHSDDTTVVAPSGEYFERLWRRAGPDLRPTDLDRWEAEIQARLATEARTAGAPWPDYGADAGIDDVVVLSEALAPLGRGGAFVKFLGKADNRVQLSETVLSEIERSGAHWALGYPLSKRPRQIRDGDIMFVGRMVQPNDIQIFGVARGLQHDTERDVASEDDIAIRAWKRNWPNYIRVYDGKFVAGTLANGVSLNRMMSTLGARSWRPTLENEQAGRGNLNPWTAYARKAGMQLTEEAHVWLQRELAQQFDLHGILPQADLDEAEAAARRRTYVQGRDDLLTLSSPAVSQ